MTREHDVQAYTQYEDDGGVGGVLECDCDGDGGEVVVVVAE